MKKIVKKTTKKVTPKVVADVCCESKDECCCKNMSPKRKYITSIIIFLVLSAGVFAYYKYANVAIVNGKGISRIEYIKLLEKQDNKNVLNQMIQESLVNGEAAKKNVKVEQSEIDAEIATIEAQIKAQGQTLESAMAAEGMTKAELEKQLRLRKLVEKLSSPTTEITQAQIDEFLVKNKELLPKDLTKDKLQAMAKEELIAQAKSDAITAWLKKLTEESKIIYK